MTNQKKSRTYNSIVNSAVGIAATAVMIVLNYVVRMVLVKELGAEINGLHNLFQGIAGVMTLMEGGISTAMIIHLYRPVEEDDRDSIIGIMSFYKRIYTVVALGFFAVNLIFDLFLLRYIVSSTIPMLRIKLYFAVFSLSFVGSYLTYYKRSILLAQQKNRVCILATSLSEVFFRVLGIVSIMVFHEYYLFLALMILEKLSCNFICTLYVNKHHPYLVRYKKRQIDPAVKSSIFGKVKPLFINNVSSTVQQSAKSILVSALLGNISIVGNFGNYQLITNMGKLVFSQFSGAFTSSFGNLAVSGGTDRTFRAYRKTAFLLNWLAIIFCSGFVCCVQDFIELTFGSKFLISIPCVFILTADLFSYLLNIPISGIQNALGLHDKDKYYMIVQAAAAVSLGYLMGLRYGMAGIFLGLLLPQLYCTLIHKGIVIYRYAFSKDARSYLSFLSLELLKGTAVISLGFFISHLFELGSALRNFLARGLVSVAVSLIMCVVLSFKNQYYIELVSSAKRFAGQRRIMRQEQMRR